MPDVDGAVTLWDWRRQVASLYSAVRAVNGGAEAWSAWARGRDALFRSHPQSPIEPERRHSFQGLSYHAYDPALRFAVALRPFAGARSSVPAGADGEVRLRPFAHTDGLMGTCGRELTLYWIEGYGGGAFLPFADATNGSQSYGGGRYLLDTIKGADLGTDEAGRTVLDFNFAYNPSCSYASQYVCPLAQAENRLQVEIRAGETVPAD